MSDNDQKLRLEQYASNLFGPEDDVLRSIQAEADHNDLPRISVQPLDGRLLQFLVHAVGAHKVVEIGTLAGYSGTWLARALPADGRLWTLEKSSKHAAVARASFERAGVAKRVTLMEGDALQSLEKLSSEGPFDMVFLDADKAGYQAYLRWAVDHVRPGGLIAAHNAFRGGTVLDPKTDDDRGMIAFNEALANDSRLEATIISMGDGMAVAVRKP